MTDVEDRIEEMRRYLDAAEQAADRARRASNKVMEPRVRQQAGYRAAVVEYAGAGASAVASEHIAYAQGVECVLPTARALLAEVDRLRFQARVAGKCSSCGAYPPSEED